MDDEDDGRSDGDDEPQEAGPKKKVRFGDEMGRIGRRRKGAGKFYQEEAERFSEQQNDGEGSSHKKRRDAGDLKSSLSSGRDLKDIENASEDWEHSEDSGEEEYRRR